MSSSKAKAGAPVVIVLDGSVGIAKARGLHHELEQALTAALVTIDTVRATYLDATAVQLIVAFRRARSASGKATVLKGPSEMLGLALAGLGLTPLLEEATP